MIEYQLGDRLWVVKLAAFFVLVVAALNGPRWCLIVFLVYVGALLLQYAIMCTIGLTATVSTVYAAWHTRRQMREMNRSERDAFEQKLVYQVNEEPVGGMTSVTGVSLLVVGKYGFASGARMQREIAMGRQNPQMRRLIAAEKWRAQIEHRQPRDVETIIAYWRQHPE